MQKVWTTLNTMGRTLLQTDGHGSQALAAKSVPSSHAPSAQTTAGLNLPGLGHDDGYVSPSVEDTFCRIIKTPSSCTPKSVSDGCELLEACSEDEFIEVPDSRRPLADDPMVPTTSQGLIAAELSAASRLGLGQHSIYLHDGAICLRFAVTQLPLAARVSGGWSANEPLVIRLDVRRGYRRASPVPQFTVNQGARTLVHPQSAGPCADAASLVAHQLGRMTARWLVEQWCIRETHFLAELYGSLQKRLAAPGAQCSLCDQPLEDDPTVLNFCDEATCRQGFSKLRTQPSFYVSTIASPALVAYFAMAAAWSQAAKSSLPYKGILPHTKDGKVISGAVVQATLSALSKSAPQNVLPHPRALQTCTAPYATDILQWVFASRPAILMPLAPVERLNKISAPGQFAVACASRQEHQQMLAWRDSPGTQYGFFTAPFRQWHTLLREGLNSSDASDASGTKVAPLQLWQDAQAALVFAHKQRKIERGLMAKNTLQADSLVLGVCEVGAFPSEPGPTPETAWHPGPGVLRFVFIYDYSAYKTQSYCAMDTVAWLRS